MPDEGRRTGNAEMGGMRWQWEQEVTELPIKGMFRIDVRARPTGETVDDSRRADQPSEQRETDSEASGTATEKLTWTTSVTGVVSSARSDRRDAIAAPLRGNNAGTTRNQPGSPDNNGAPNPPGTPATPGPPRGPDLPRNPGNNPGAPPPPPTETER
jgi:hypothetical protein